MSHSVIVDGNSKATLYTAYGESGSITVTVVTVDGGRPGRVKAWCAGFHNFDYGVIDGEKTIHFTLYINLRVGFSFDGPVRVTASHENVTAVHDIPTGPIRRITNVDEEGEAPKVDQSSLARCALQCHYATALEDVVDEAKRKGDFWIAAEPPSGT